MNSGHYQRKIQAILSADAVGYSRLMGDDEEATVGTISEYRGAMSDLIDRHHGRVIDAPGDNLLAVFDSVVDALRCGWDIQQELAVRNQQLDENRRMHFRIGIHLGDVIEEDNRLYGDGVNVTARLESLAAPGGINISGAAYDQVKNKLPYRFEFLGEQQVKNISDPVRVYRVEMAPEAQTGGVYSEPTKRKHSRAAIVGIISVFVLVLAVGLYMWVGEQDGSVSDRRKADDGSLSISQGASIAVLPFKNLSDDAKQEYFSDGITEDIITYLSRFHDLLVIASNTVFTYKGKTVNIKTVGQELGVRYVLEGSVRKAGDRVRINAQLIDADTEQHLWAERYERQLKDIFAVQDDIVRTITSTMAVKVGDAERRRVKRHNTENMVAYDYVLRGRELYNKITRSSNAEARKMFQKAIELDPEYATAYVYLGWTYQTAVSYGWTEFPVAALQRSHDLAQKALSIEESSDAHTLLGTGYRYRGQLELAAEQLDKAIELNPNDSISHAYRGSNLAYLGRTDEAMQSLETAHRFNPNMTSGSLMHLGLAYYLKGRYEDAVRHLERSVGKYPQEVFLHIALAAAYAQVGRSADAEREVQIVMKLHPFFQVDSYGFAFRNPDHRAHIRAGLRKAGFQ